MLPQPANLGATTRLSPCLPVSAGLAPKGFSVEGARLLRLRPESVKSTLFFSFLPPLRGLLARPLRRGGAADTPARRRCQATSLFFSRAPRNRAFPQRL